MKNGKLIILSPSEECTVQCNGGPLQDTTFSAQAGGGIPLFIFNINKRQRHATEKRIKEKYSWEQGDKKVIKALRKTECGGEETERERDSEAGLLSKPLPCFLKHYSEKCGYCSVDRSICMLHRRQIKYILITNYFAGALQNKLVHLQEGIFCHC